MHCYEFENNIISYYEGKIPQSLAAAMQKHMEHCSSCMALYHKVTSTYTALDHPGEVPQFAAENFLAGVEAKLQQGRQNRAALFIKRISAVAATAIIIAGLAGGFFLGKEIAPATDGNSLATQETYINTLASEFYIETEEKYAFDTYYEEGEK
jgi:anti-sigma factor RsiW